MQCIKLSLILTPFMYIIIVFSPEMWAEMTTSWGWHSFITCYFVRLKIKNYGHLLFITHKSVKTSIIVQCMGAATENKPEVMQSSMPGADVQNS